MPDRCSAASPRTVSTTSSKQTRSPSARASWQCVLMRASSGRSPGPGWATSTIARDGWRTPRSISVRTMRSAAASSTTGHDQVEDRCAGVRQPLLGDERCAVVVAARRRVPHRREVRGDGAHARVARLPQRRGQALVLAEAHEPPMDGLLLGDDVGRPLGHGLRQARPSRSSSSSAAGGPQRPGTVEVERPALAGLPGPQDRVEDLPRALDLVVAGEEAVVADHRVDQQRLVRVRRVDRERRSVAEVHVHGPDLEALARAPWRRSAGGCPRRAGRGWRARSGRPGSRRPARRAPAAHGGTGPRSRSPGSGAPCRCGCRTAPRPSARSRSPASGPRTSRSRSRAAPPARRGTR